MDSMARFKSAPKKLGDIHPRYLTPATSTLLMGAVSLAWTLFIINISTNVLADSITGLGFQIAFYYGLTGFACALYYRREGKDAARAVHGASHAAASGSSAQKSGQRAIALAKRSSASSRWPTACGTGSPPTCSRPTSSTPARCGATAQPS